MAHFSRILAVTVLLMLGKWSVFLPFSPGPFQYVSEKSSIQVLQIQDYATRCFSDKAFCRTRSIMKEEEVSGFFSFHTFRKG